MPNTYYVTPDHWTDQYIQQVAKIFGESPVFAGEVPGREKFSKQPCQYVAYTLEKEPRTMDENWITGSTHERMLASGLIGEVAPIADPVSAEPEPTKEQPNGPVLTTLRPWGNNYKFEVLALQHGADELEYGPAFKEDEAKAYIAEKYPDSQFTDLNAFFVEYRRRVDESGFSFEDRARFWR